MAKILYTVCGIGLGHATRSTPLIKSLMKNHTVLVTSYGEAYNYLKRYFQTEEALHWFKLLFTEDRFRKTHTLFYNLPLLPYVAAKNIIRAIKIFRRFKPDIIVSDFDVNGIYMAELFNIPVVTISNMHLMNHKKIPLSLNDKIGYYLTEKPVLNAFNGTDYLLVSSFVQPAPSSNSTFFFKPLVREAILNRQPKENGKILVYSTPNQLDLIMPLLKNFFSEQRFVVFGKGAAKREANLDFRAFSEKGFIEELQNCSAVMCHGGISVLSESFFLKKPMYVFTCKEFFERYYNGAIIQSLGFGTLQEKPTRQNIEFFLESLKDFRSNLKQADTSSGNKDVMKKIEEIIEKECR